MMADRKLTSGRRQTNPLPTPNLAFGLLLLLAGCQERIDIPTASGRPEVTIAAPTDLVKSAYINALLNRGYQVVEDTSQ